MTPGTTPRLPRTSTGHDVCRASTLKPSAIGSATRVIAPGVPAHTTLCETSDSTPNVTASSSHGRVVAPGREREPTDDDDLRHECDDRTGAEHDRRRDAGGFDVRGDPADLPEQPCERRRDDARGRKRALAVDRPHVVRPQQHRDQRDHDPAEDAQHRSRRRLEELRQDGSAEQIRLSRQAGNAEHDRGEPWPPVLGRDDGEPSSNALGASSNALPTELSMPCVSRQPHHSANDRAEPTGAIAKAATRRRATRSRSEVQTPRAPTPVAQDRAHRPSTKRGCGARVPGCIERAVDGGIAQ